MMADALDGKIDLIITKSVSRFARNTVDSLLAVRQLKEKGVEVYFQKEAIYTLDAKGELLITIMSSLAQEESRSISENVQWGKRRAFEQGKVSMAYKLFLGYEKGPDGTPQVVEEQAKVVRRIFTLFLEGRTIRQICATLTGEGIPTPAGKEVWAVSTVKSILQNEKYTGNAILQKRYTVDFLNKVTKPNQGELPQYYVRDSHPAIVSQETYDLTQAELARRASLGKKFNGNGLFFCKILCGDCGGFYGSKVWHSNDPYRRVVWLCNGKYGEKLHCGTPHLTEEAIQRAFVKAYNRLFSEKGRLLPDLDAALRQLDDTSVLDNEIMPLQISMGDTLKDIEALVRQNADIAQDQEEYARRYDSLAADYKAAKERLDGLMAEQRERCLQAEKLRRFREALSTAGEPLKAFDSRLWCAVVDTVTVYSMNRVAVCFSGGTRVEIAPDG
jgi:DNA invertase Pin-like site-specific DNA recombinase